MSLVTLMEGSDPRIDLYESGYSVSQIAAMTNYSKSGVYSWLRAHDVEMRPRGYPNGTTGEDESKQQEAS